MKHAIVSWFLLNNTIVRLMNILHVTKFHESDLKWK